MREPLFPETFGWSIIAHLLFFLVLGFYQKFFFQHLRIKPSAYQVSIVSLTPPKGKGGHDQNEVSVPAPAPVNQLPRATVQQIEEAVNKPVQKEAMPLPQQKPVDMKKEMERLKAELKRQEEIRRMTKNISQALNAKPDPKAPPAKPSTTAAAVGSAAAGTGAGEAGGSPDGVAGQFVLGQYQDIVRQHVLAQWNLPQWTVDQLPKETFAVLVVYINSAGEVLRTEFAKSSNIEHFDQSALRAIRRAAPLPVPPADLQKEAEVRGIRMRFSPTKE